MDKIGTELFAMRNDWGEEQQQERGLKREWGRERGRERGRGGAQII